jgi:FixJ family two-component response regulator
LKAPANPIELDSIRDSLEHLTQREREALALVVEGRLNKQVACKLGTAEKTIKIHRARGTDKLEVRSLAEPVRIR